MGENKIKIRSSARAFLLKRTPGEKQSQEESSPGGKMIHSLRQSSVELESWNVIHPERKIDKVEEHDI